MDRNGTRGIVEREIGKNDGILRLRPCLVARTFLKPGKRLGLTEEQYNVGKRGWICERWLGSETEADNEVKEPNEGLSYLDIEGEDILVREATAAAGDLIMGERYAQAHPDLGRLAKIFDYRSRIFFHFHQTQESARKVGRNSKEEAYYFPEGVDLGPHPETFFGVHPYIVEQGRQEEILLPYLQKWEGDGILAHSRAYANVPGEGFHLPAGVLHAPGTALTIELQEASDVMGVLQAKVDGLPISKDLLTKDVPPEDREKRGERSVLDQLVWEINGDPYFYENRHTPPVVIEESRQPGGVEAWIYYNTTRFSGKRLVVKPGQSYRSVDRGVYNVLVWKGSGRADGHPIEGQNIGRDEILVTHDRAAAGVVYENTGSVDLEILKFFGPDVNNDGVPYLPRYPR